MVRAIVERGSEKALSTVGGTPIDESVELDKPKGGMPKSKSSGLDVGYRKRVLGSSNQPQSL